MVIVETSLEKDTCFVFDFDPNRALTLIHQCRTELAGTASTSSDPQDLDHSGVALGTRGPVD